jgi:Rps23 Pro-64 3,4-dihydroxylase Tpa1-like proline 4-hydroxylase
MTEQEFDSQVWRRFDVVTTDTGIETTVMNVCFTTRSVRIYIKDAPPEWLPAKRIVTHTTRKGDTADEGTIIEELHDKIMKQDGQIERLKNEKAQLQEKISKNYLGDLLRSVNLMQQGLQEKKHKMEKIDSGLRQIQATLAAINNE